ncbi:MAG: serine hydrolase [Bacteroidota bacterium]
MKIFRPFHWCLSTSLFFLSTLLYAQEIVPYYPEPGAAWEHKSPEALGLNPDSIQAAIEFAISQESANSPDLEQHHYVSFGREPFGDAVGPHKVRGPQTGIIVKDGYIVAEWGDPHRVDMTFSVTKSFLSSTVGLAYDREMIQDINDPVYTYIAPVSIVDFDPSASKAEQFGQAKVYEPFETEHNRKITWNHLLRQTSDWEGTLWGKPDWADRPRGEPDTWLTRERHEPGTHYKYNDVRVNVLALAAMNIWRRPLQQVLKEYVMDPIGASATWRWHGYENSWILIDGVAMQVPSGGGHWGGGMFINAFDQARFGYLTLRRGQWDGKQILSEEWVGMALTPTEAQDTYGFMNWFLNTDKKRMPNAPESSFHHVGAGANIVYVDPVHDLVIVARWIDGVTAMDELVRRVLVSIE